MAQNHSQFISRKIKEKFQELNPANDPTRTVWLMSLDNELEESRAGIMTAAHVGHTTPVNRPIEPHVFTAARCIVEGTHRLATDEEISSYQADQDSRRALAKKLEQEKKMHISPVMNFPPELIAAFLASVAKTETSINALGDWPMDIDTAEAAPKKAKGK